MKDWWKDPRLDDEGTYDYYAEELPKDHCEWEMNKYTSRCDCCGKERHLLFRATHYFYCWDGWDCMDSTECWICMIERQIQAVRHRFKKKIKTIKMAMELHQISPKWNWKKCYECAVKIER